MKLYTPILLLTTLLLTGCGPSAERDESGNIVTEGAVDAFAMKVGDCFNDSAAILSDEAVDAVSGLPCTEPHDNEVFAQFDVTLDEYPGDEPISELSAKACIDRFEAFVGKPYDTSELDTFAVFPTRESWKMLGDREVLCAVYHVDEKKLTGSMEDAGI